MEHRKVDVRDGAAVARTPRARAWTITTVAATVCAVAACSEESAAPMTPVGDVAALPPPTTAGVGGLAGAGAAGSAPSGSAGQTGNAGQQAGSDSMGGPTAATGGAVGPAVGGAGGAGGEMTEPEPAGGAGGTMMEPEPAGGAGAAAAGGGAAGMPMMPPTCEPGVVQASEVVFIGESFIALSGAIPRFTSELAREAGTIGASESYRSYAVSGTQLTTGAIPEQFTRAVSEGPVKVVLMDGGGNDLLIGSRCRGGVDASCREIVTTVQTLFAQMKMDGVEDVVYFFYPDPMGIGAGIKDAMDILRPEMRKACEEATDVRCVWVDQRESWEGNYATYTSDGIHPTDAGSRASAQQIWDAMVASCIAQ